MTFLQRDLALTRMLYFLTAVILSSCWAEERFTEQPADDVVSQGQLHILRCTVVDQRGGQIQWLRDGFGLGPGTLFSGYPRYRIVENIPGGEYHLMISDIQLEDDAVFECQVGATNQSQGLKSRRARLTVQLPTDEVNLIGSVRQEVIAGSPYVITCNARNGKPAPTITWLSAGHTLVSSSDDVTIENVVTIQGDGKREDVTSRLTFVPVKGRDQGREFTCSAVNAAMIEARTASVNVDVLYRPEVSLMASQTQIVKEQEALILTCSADGNPNDITWKWYRDEDENAIESETSSTLSLPAVTRSLHNAHLSCEASNRVGKTRQTYIVQVQYGPRFTVEPEEYAADPGDPVILLCPVDSNPAPAVVWRRRGSSRVLASQVSMSIDHVTEDLFAPSTVFTCTASVNGYEEIHRDVRILKRGAPQMVSPSEQWGRYGETGLIECATEGVPKPNNVFWAKNGRQLDFTATKRYEMSIEDTPNGRWRSALTVDKVQDEDFALYNCTAVNNYGASSLGIKFTKQAAIPLAYILTGVFVGMFLIILVIIIVFVVNRRRRIRTDSDMSSNSSDDSTKKMSRHQPNLKIEYSDSLDGFQRNSLVDTSPYPPPPPLDQKEYYDEPPLMSQFRDPLYPTAYDPNGYPTVYGSCRRPDPYSRYPPGAVDNVYGTYPRGGGGAVGSYPYGTAPSNRPYDPREPAEAVFGGGDIYGTYSRRQPQFNSEYNRPVNDFYPPSLVVAHPPTQSYGLPPPASPTDSRLSTNV